MEETNQAIMEKLFSDWETFPINSMIPRMFYKKEGSIDREAVVFLILGDDYMVSDFKLEPPDGNVEIDATISLRQNENKIGKDLYIRFDFLFPTGHPIFDVTIYGDDPLTQKTFCEALIRVDKLYLFVASQEFKLISVKELTWNATNYPEIYEILDRKPYKM